MEKFCPDALATLLEANADEPNAGRLAPAIAGRTFTTTSSLADAVRAALSGLNR